MKDQETKKLQKLKRKQNMVGLSPWDPMGSYTGLPFEPNEVPVQDADDL